MTSTLYWFQTDYFDWIRIGLASVCSHIIVKRIPSVTCVLGCIIAFLGTLAYCTVHFCTILYWSDFR
jgi:hypothetical protein